jgi:glycosyltransferase involved in cell wall biosynthesis
MRDLGMKIALISPARRSGGNIYSQNLSKGLDATIIPAELPLSRIRAEVSKNRFDVVDIQLEYRTFGSHLRTLLYLPVLALLLKDMSEVFVTVHGILTPQSLRGQHLRLPKLIAFVLSVKLSALFSNQMLVHTASMRGELIRYGVKNVTVIPHGSGPFSYEPQAESRNSVFFFGFIRPSKGIESLVLAFGRVIQTHPKAHLVVAGDVSDPGEGAYFASLSNLVLSTGLQDHVSFRRGFLGDADKKSLAANSGILALPYTDSYLEVSGVVHDFAGFGVSVLCSQTPRFSELSDGFNCLKVRVTPSEVADAICRLLDDVELRERLATNLLMLAQTESWPAVSKMRLDLYRRLIGPE